jgi:hypothetical protein
MKKPKAKRSRRAPAPSAAACRECLKRTNARRGVEFDKIVDSVIDKPSGHEIEWKKRPRTCGAVLYAITTVASFLPRPCVAICNTFERAKEIVERNEGDIFEYAYSLVVIEAVEADRLNGTTGLLEQYWYVWRGTPEDGSYRPIHCPEAYEHMTGWGVG